MVDWVPKKNGKKLTRSFKFTFRYIDDILSLNNSRFGDVVDRIYPIELEIKDTTNTDRSASYLDLHLGTDSEGWVRTKLYSNFNIVNFPFVCSNILAAPGVYISQLIRYLRACGSYKEILDRGLLLTRKLLNQGFLVVKLKPSLWQFYVATTVMENLCHKWPRICSTCRSFLHSWLITEFVTRFTRRVPLVEQELLTLPEHMCSICS